MTVKRIPRRKPRDRGEMMKACMPFTKNQVARAFNTWTPGINWMGCSKGHMADVWARAHNTLGHTCLRKIEIRHIMMAVRYPDRTVDDAYYRAAKETKFKWKGGSPHERDTLRAMMHQALPGISDEYIEWQLRHF